MKPSKRLRFGLWLERFHWLYPVLLKLDAVLPDGRRRCVNRVSRTLVMIGAAS